MTESFELRVVEEFADRLLRPDEGKKLRSGIVRLVKINADDARIPQIAQLQKSLNQEMDKSFFYGWEIFRKYGRREFEEAALFSLKVTSTFEPAGEECGTRYDESTGCSKCGCGARQITPLYLPQKRIPKSKDFSRTIAGEVVVSRRVKEVFIRHGIAGAEFSPIRFNPSSSAESKDWFQLIILNAMAEIVAPTRTGINPFDEDHKGEYRCATGDLIGLNMLSEVSVNSASFGDADIACTRQFVGTRRGLLRPERIILISPKIRRLIESEKLKGVEVEVAHLV